MSEKVMLTAAQAEAIEHFRKNGSSNAGILDNHFYKHYESDMYKRLSEEKIDTDRLVNALYNGYEVEETFKPGDKVVHVNYLNYEEWKPDFKIAKVEGEGIRYKGEHFFGLAGLGEYNGNYIRHATPEEIYWLETLAREKVGDFRIGDQYVYSDSDRSFKIDVRERIEVVGELYAAGKLIGIYPAESFKPFPKEGAE